MSGSEVDDMAKKLKNWNPMAEAYLDSNFNLYDSGPGAALDKALQPAELAKEQKGLIPSSENRRRVDPFVIVKNLPKDMTSKGIKNICQNYGNVKEITYAPKTQSVYVKFYNVADMEAVFRGLHKNKYGFDVVIGRCFKEERNTTLPFEDWHNRAILEITPPNSGVNMERREIRPSGKNPERPKFDEKISEIDEEKCALPEKDPLLFVLKQGDAHSLERAGLSTAKNESKDSDEFDYFTGRIVRKMPSKLRDYCETAHKKSIGSYNAEKDVYSNKSKNSKTKFALIHKCIVCKEPADTSCYRCLPKIYVYCSPNCQKADLEEHRKICGKKQENESKRSPLKPRESFSSENLSDSPFTKESHNSKKVESQREKASHSFSSSSSHNDSFTSLSFPKPEMPPSNSTVVMTAVSKVNIVFIRSNAPEDNTKYFEMITEIQNVPKNWKPLKRLPKVGQAVIAKFQKSNEYGRALVLSVTDDANIKVNFQEYGNIETLSLLNIFWLPKRYYDLPRFAVPVVLKDVPNCYMTNEVRSFMYSYLKDIELVVKYDKENDLIPITNVYQVELYDAATNENLNKLITALCQPEEPKGTGEYVMWQDLEKVELPVGKNIQYYIMDNSQLNIGCISCTTKDYALEIEKFTNEDVNRYANSLKEQCYTPREDELCIAKYSQDGRWYRGRCLEKVGDGRPTILYIDYGNIAFVKVNDIRPYPPKFVWPVYTADFGIEGLPEQVNDELVERLEDLLPCGYPINCDAVEKFEGNFYNVQLHGLIKTLKKENLLD